jgi:FKBP-type peptidyl-prolyl cis-trans isomerase SlyD
MSHPAQVLDLTHAQARPLSLATIERDRVVGYRFTIRDDQGDVLDVSRPGEVVYYLHGAGTSPVGLEAQLEGRREGDFCCITLLPGCAFGEPAARRYVALPRKLFASDVALEPGMCIDATTSEGKVVPMWVLDADEAVMRVDFDHPLAGRTLHFEISVVSVRAASVDERLRRYLRGRARRGASGVRLHTTPALEPSRRQKQYPWRLTKHLRSARQAEPGDARVELARLRTMMAATFAAEESRDALGEVAASARERRAAGLEHDRLLGDLDSIIAGAGGLATPLKMKRALDSMREDLGAHEAGEIASLQQLLQTDVGGSG